MCAFEWIKSVFYLHLCLCKVGNFCFLYNTLILELLICLSWSGLELYHFLSRVADIGQFNLSSISFICFSACLLTGLHTLHCRSCCSVAQLSHAGGSCVLWSQPKMIFNPIYGFTFLLNTNVWIRIVYWCFLSKPVEGSTILALLTLLIACIC